MFMASYFALVGKVEYFTEFGLILIIRVEIKIPFIVDLIEFDDALLNTFIRIFLHTEDERVCGFQHRVEFMFVDDFDGHA